MKRIPLMVIAAVCAIGAVTCGTESRSTVSPSSAQPANAAEGYPDGSTLKVTAPTPQSPVGGQRLEQGGDAIPLVARNASRKFAADIAVTYRFRVFNAAGGLLVDAGNIAEGAGTTAYAVTAQLEGDQTYSWQVRAESQGEAGPWSALATFVAPTTTGYMRGNELYDPLISGVTIGEKHGPLTFIPGVGVRLETQLSYISYVLPQTLTEGEFSILVTGMPANTEGDKTKLFAMGQNYDDIVTNERRMTVEKRGDPAGVVAWRFITHDDQVDTEGADRQFIDFQASQTYFWQASWRANRFNLLIKEGGADGRLIYNLGKNFKGRPYDPTPHVIYVGAPVGRSGESGASVDHAIIRQVWVSARPRPAFANK
jgi:hypothetical protein